MVEKSRVQTPPDKMRHIKYSVNEGTSSNQGTEEVEATEAAEQLKIYIICINRRCVRFHIICIEFPHNTSQKAQPCSFTSFVPLLANDSVGEGKIKQMEKNNDRGWPDIYCMCIGMYLRVCLHAFVIYMCI